MLLTTAGHTGCTSNSLRFFKTLKETFFFEKQTRSYYDPNFEYPELHVTGGASAGLILNTNRTWQASTYYYRFDPDKGLVKPTSPNGFVYRVDPFTSGFSGGSEPSWPTTAGDTVVDNEVTWVCQPEGDFVFYYNVVSNFHISSIFPGGTPLSSVCVETGFKTGEMPDPLGLDVAIRLDNRDNNFNTPLPGTYRGNYSLHIGRGLDETGNLRNTYNQGSEPAASLVNGLNLLCNQYAVINANYKIVLSCYFTGWQWAWDPMTGWHLYAGSSDYYNMVEVYKVAVAGGTETLVGTWTSTTPGPCGLNAGIRIDATSFITDKIYVIVDGVVESGPFTTLSGTSGRYDVYQSGGGTLPCPSPPEFPPNPEVEQLWPEDPSMWEVSQVISGYSWPATWTEVCDKKSMIALGPDANYVCRWLPTFNALDVQVYKDDVLLGTMSDEYWVNKDGIYLGNPPRIQMGFSRNPSVFIPEEKMAYLKEIWWREITEAARDDDPIYPPDGFPPGGGPYGWSPYW